jgi:hypothetical protein
MARVLGDIGISLHALLAVAQSVHTKENKLQGCFKAVTLFESIICLMRLKRSSVGEVLDSEVKTVRIFSGDRGPK